MNQSRRSNLNNIGDMSINGSLTLNGEEEASDGKLLLKGELQIANDLGDYTIMAKEGYLAVKDNKSGKLYKIVLQEITEG